MPRRLRSSGRRRGSRTPPSSVVTGQHELAGYALLQRLERLAHLPKRQRVHRPWCDLVGGEQGEYLGKVFLVGARLRVLQQPGVVEDRGTAVRQQPRGGDSTEKADSTHQHVRSSIAESGVLPVRD